MLFFPLFLFCRLKPIFCSSHQLHQFYCFFYTNILGRMEMIEMHRISLKIVTRLSVIFTVIGLLLVIIGICTGTIMGLIILGAGLVELVGTIIFIAVFRRCPHCGSFLKTGCNRYCPHCGKYVDENDYIYF